MFKVHTTSGVVEFKPSKRGLHSLNMAEHGAWQDDPAYACDNDNGDLKTDEEDGSNDFVMVQLW